MKVETSITEFTDQIKQYVRTTTEIIKLEILKRTVVMSSFIIIQLILWALVGLVLFMFSIALGFYLSRYYNDYILGFGMVATCYVGLVFILLLIGPKRLEKVMQNKLLKQMYEEKSTS